MKKSISLLSKAALSSTTKPIRIRSAPRPKYQLKLSQLENMWAALSHAEVIGLRPSAALDINFGAGDLFEPDKNAGSSLRAFIKLARQWIEKRGAQTAYIYVFENRHTCPDETGVHAHVLIHVPSAMLSDFHRMKKKWVKNKAVRMKCKPRLFAPTNRAKNAIKTFEGVSGKLLYMSKDLDPGAMANGVPFLEARGFNLDDRGKPSTGPVFGLKCGVSRNINVKARTSYQQPFQTKNLVNHEASIR
jgi:hypothetical protein